MRKLIIAAVWILGAGMNESFIHLASVPWLFIWTLGFFVCGCVTVGLILIGMLWPISTDIADWAEKKFK